MKVKDDIEDPAPRNCGWRCATISTYRFESYVMPGASDIVLHHIKVDHPDFYATGNWSMQGIRIPYVHFNGFSISQKQILKFRRAGCRL